MYGSHFLLVRNGLFNHPLCVCPLYVCPQFSEECGYMAEECGYMAEDRGYMVEEPVVWRKSAVI